jgi:hypothetical protein
MRCRYVRFGWKADITGPQFPRSQDVPDRKSYYRGFTRYKPDS